MNFHLWSWGEGHKSIFKSVFYANVMVQTLIKSAAVELVRLFQIWDRLGSSRFITNGNIWLLISWPWPFGQTKTLTFWFRDLDLWLRSRKRNLLSISFFYVHCMVPFLINPIKPFRIYCMQNKKIDLHPLLFLSPYLPEILSVLE